MPSNDTEKKDIYYIRDWINNVYVPNFKTGVGGNVMNDYLRNENRYIKNEKSHEELTGILNVRKKMLEVNLERNDVKNKIIYTLFSLIMIMIIVTISVHTNFKK